MFNSIQRKALLMIILVGMICVSIVLLSAYAAELKVGNNQLATANETLQGEIASLDVKITSANSIDQIEAIATTQLGMVYAAENECIYISQDDAPDGSLAMLIRSNNYH